jgi:hypothetical protein
MREMRLQSRATEVALDRLPFGVVIADATGRAVVVNRAAEDMAAANDGLCLSDGRLTASGAQEAAGLACQIAKAAQSAGRRNGEAGASLSIARPSGRRPYAVLVAPLSPGTALAAEHEVPAALILITDLDQRPEVPGRHLVSCSA